MSALGQQQSFNILTLVLLLSVKSRHWDLTQVSELPGQDR